jgi:two-component system, LytTR family, sensor histidine kinase AlgZ
MKRVRPDAGPPADLIPDFCGGGALLTQAFVLQLVAFALTLAGDARGGDAVARLMMLTIYLQWIGVISAGLLCWARSWLAVARPAVVFLVCWGMLVAVVVLMSDLGYLVVVELRWAEFLPAESRLEFIARHSFIAGVVSLGMLRYYWTRNQWEQNVKAEGEARYQALNARIKPHFLFNSLNSVAQLIHSRPNDAEDMVVDLSELFRASLEKRGQLGTLAEELDLCRAYMRIEQVRLSEKLQVEWDVPEELLDWELPMLVIQPLIENAVHHGVSRMTQSGVIRVTIRKVSRQLVIEVENPIPSEDVEGEQATRRGNHIAVDNIAQRLTLIYGDRAKLEMGKDPRLYGPVFRVRLSLPEAPRHREFT